MGTCMSPSVEAAENMIRSLPTRRRRDQGRPKIQAGGPTAASAIQLVLVGKLTSSWVWACPITDAEPMRIRGSIDPPYSKRRRTPTSAQTLVARLQEVFDERMALLETLRPVESSDAAKLQVVRSLLEDVATLGRQIAVLERALADRTRPPSP